MVLAHSAMIRRQFFKQNFNKQMLDVNIVHELRHKAKRADSNESDDNEKYLIWYSYACLVARKDRKRKEIFLPNISIKKNFFFFFQLKTVAHASFLINFHYAPFIEQFFFEWIQFYLNASREKGPIISCRKCCKSFPQKTGMWKIIEKREEKYTTLLRCIIARYI